MLNVRDFGALGNNTHNDFTAIQDALNAASNAGGGIVFFPPGTYVINETLKLPSKVQMLGIGGTTFGAGSGDISNHDLTPETFLLQAISIIKLEEEANCNMLEPKDGLSYLFNAGIENIVFYGNMSQQSTSDENNCNGIYLNDIIDTNTITNHSEAGHNRFTNILLYQVKFNGFYGGMRHNELFLDYVFAYGCGRNGFKLYGIDCKYSRMGAGNNSASGIKICFGGASRFYDIDTWANEYGVEISDAMNIYFFGLTSNINKKNGLFIHPSDTSTGWSPSQVQIIRGKFDQNSRETSSSYSDVKIDSTDPKEGPAFLLFDACSFGGCPAVIENISQNQPGVPIEDISYKPARNIVTNSFFYRENYVSQQIINLMDIYSCKNNFDYVTKKCLDEANVPYKWINLSATLSITDCYVTVDTTDDPTEITLPLLENTQLGKIFIISKTSSDGNSLVVGTTSPNIMTGIDTISGQFGTLMIVNANSSWYGIKIS